jgi:4-hydroxy-tetrahydrodipicolinate synthase
VQEYVENRGLMGVYTILSTPFLPDGRLDDASLARLTDAVVKTGVDGVTALGVAGEAHKLTDAERARVLDIVFDAAAGRVKVVVGVSRDGTIPALEAAKDASRRGAHAIMLAPPAFLQPGPALTAHVAEVANKSAMKVVLQDFPPANGVTMSPAQMAEITKTCSWVRTIKLEDPPTPIRSLQTLRESAKGTTVLGGIGAQYFLDELRMGTFGMMTGFAFPEVLVAIWEAWRNRDRARAARIFAWYLPLINFEGQPKIGLAIRKEILRQRGLIDHATVRQPGPALDEKVIEALAEVLATVEIDPANAGSIATV